MPRKIVLFIVIFSGLLIACGSISFSPQTEPDIDLSQLVVTERPTKTPPPTVTPFPSAIPPEKTKTPKVPSLESEIQPEDASNSSLPEEIDFTDAADIEIDPALVDEENDEWNKIPYGISEPNRCPDTTNNIPEIECSILIVPENPSFSGSTDKKLAIQIAVLKKLNKASVADPLIYIAGGPGGQAVNYIGANYDNYYESLRQDRDLIVFDPRGNGLSFPNMDCPDLKTAYGIALLPSTTDQRKLDLLLEGLDHCQVVLKIGNGLDVTQYTSRNIAHDINQILIALEYERADLLGVSYGTRIAQVTAALFPEKIDQLILDSAVPVPSLYLDEVKARTDWALNHLFKSCSNDSACKESYPNIEEVFAETKARLNANPIPVNIPASYGLPAYQATLTGDTVSLAVLKAMNNPSLRSYVIQGITDLSRDNYRLFQLSKNDLIALVGDLSLGSYISTECAEQIMPSQVSEVGAFDAELFESEQLLFLTLLGDSAIEEFQKVCRAWGIDSAEPEVDISQVESEILILSGAFDTLTPPLYGFQVEESYPNTVHFLFPDMGHAVLGRAETSCPINMTLAFLASEPIDSSCIEAEHQFKFFNPQLALENESISFEPAPIPNTEISAIRPAGWTDVGDNNFFRLPGYDKTSVLIQAAAVAPDQWLDFIFENYKNTGLENYPMLAEGKKPPQYATWEFYETIDKGDSITIAFHIENGITKMVLISGFPEEHDVLSKNVLYPILDHLINTDT